MHPGVAAYVIRYTSSRSRLCLGKEKRYGGLFVPCFEVVSDEFVGKKMR